MAILPLLNLGDARGCVDGAGRALAAEIAGRLRAGTLDKEGVELVAGMFERVAAGEDANVVTLVTRTHRPRKSERDYWIFCRVADLLEDGNRAKTAYQIVAAELAGFGESVTAKTVKNIFFRWATGAEEADAAIRESEE